MVLPSDPSPSPTPSPKTPRAHVEKLERINPAEVFLGIFVLTLLAIVSGVALWSADASNAEVLPPSTTPVVRLVAAPMIAPSPTPRIMRPIEVPPLPSPAPLAYDSISTPTPPTPTFTPLPPILGAQSIWRDCNIDTQPLQAGIIYADGDFVFANDVPIIMAILGLVGEPVPWNRETGFGIEESALRLMWLTITLANGDNRYVQISKGRITNRYYAFATDSRAEYVARYGGVESWHVRCGGWILSDSGVVDRIYQMFEATRRDTP